MVKLVHVLPCLPCLTQTIAFLIPGLEGMHAPPQKDSIENFSFILDGQHHISCFVAKPHEHDAMLLAMEH